MEKELSGIFFIFAVFLVLRIFNERSMKQLSSEQKARLVDLFSSFRIYSAIFLFVVMGSFFALIRLQVMDPMTLGILYIFTLVTYVSIVSVWSYRKLQKNDYPESFVRFYLIASCVRLLSLAVFLFLTLNRT